MNRPARHVSGFPGSIPTGLAVAMLVALSVPAGRAQAASARMAFAENRVAVEIVSPRGPVPEPVLSVLPIAMKAAIEHIGAPREPARLTIRLQKPPRFHRRAFSWFRVEPAASQTDDEILLQADDDPLKLAFRIAHELSHWLVSKRHPVRPPLWLDEGLAQMVAAAAAETCARTVQQKLERPLPPELERNLFRLEELTALKTYPASEDRSAAFYWQAEKLVQSIRGRLGPAEFSAYLDILSSSGPTDWKSTLRERWYFSDWDMNWLSEQIRPTAPPAASNRPAP